MKTFKLLFLFTVLLLSSSCAIYRHYGTYYGKVIDEETQKPLEGAVILAVYRTYLYASPGGPSSYFLDAQEVVTDKNGEFRIPVFNAFAFRPLSTFSPLNPYVTIFKPRYECYIKPLINDYYQTVELHELRTKEQRVVNLRGCYPLSVPNNKMRKYIELEDAENIDLGLGPRPMRKE